MLEALIIIIVIAWLLGFTVLHLGGLVHFLLLLAAVVVLIRIIKGERPL